MARTKKQDPEVDVVDATPADNVTIIDVEEQAEEITAKAISKYNLTDLKIAELKAKYEGLQITDFNDKTQKEVIKSADKEVGGLIRAVEKKRTELKAPFLKAGQLIDGEAKRITAILSEVYEPIKALVTAVKSHEKAEEERKKAEAEAELKRRVETIIEAGAKFDGAFYSLGDTISLDITSIKSLKEADFDFLIAKIKVEKERLDKLAEEERKRKEEEEAERQRKDAELKQKQEELERKEKEQEERERKQKEEYEKQMLELRVMKLEAVGFIHDVKAKTLKFHNTQGSVVLTHGNLLVFENNAEFAEQLEDWKQDIAELKVKEQEAQAEAERKAKAEAEEAERRAKEDAEKKAREELINTRLELLNKHNFRHVRGKFSHVSGLDEYDLTIEQVTESLTEDFINLVEKCQSINEAWVESEKARIENERKAKLSDAEAIKEYFEEIIKVAEEKYPDIKDEYLRDRVAGARDAIFKHLADVTTDKQVQELFND